MRKFWVGGLSVVAMMLMNTLALAGGFGFGGWVEAGIYANSHGYRTDYENGIFGNGDVMNNVALSDLQMNQLWLYGGKVIDTRCGWDWGGRIDFVYGTDAIYTQSRGLEKGKWVSGDYFSSLAQIYGELGYRNIGVKFGKFLTPIGHESLMSPERFFYSTSYAFGLAPKTQTGALFTWESNKCFSVFAGWTCGESLRGDDDEWQYYLGPYQQVYGDTFNNSENGAFLFGCDYQFNAKLNLGYAALIGKQDDFSYGGLAGIEREYYLHSFIVNFKPSCRWDYTFEWTLRNDNFNAAPGSAHNGAYGINNELIYKLNSHWSFGLRAEWLKHYSYDFGSDNGYAFTIGANWTPNKWLKIRPEVRYDTWDGDTGYGYFDEDNTDQLSFGISGIVRF